MHFKEIELSLVKVFSFNMTCCSSEELFTSFFELSLINNFEFASNVATGFIFLQIQSPFSEGSH